MKKIKLYITSYISLLMAGREAVANKAGYDARRCDVANAGDVSPIQKGEWIQVAPYGDHEGSRPGRLQHFHKAQAEAMVSEFNSWKAKLGRFFRGRSIFIGHPDADPAHYPDERRLGKIMKLEARANGLWAEPEWNALGNENIDEGYWVFPSPYWDAPAGKSRFEPVRLISIGLTNNPRIAVSEPVSNTDDQNQTDKTMDRQAILKKLDLPAEATDKEAFAKLDLIIEAAISKKDEKAAEEMKNSLTKANTSLTEANAARETAEHALTTEREKITGLETRLQDARTAHANSLLETAVETGRVDKADRKGWEDRFASDFEATSNSLGDIKPTLSTQELLLAKSRERVSNEGSRREKVANAVQAKKDANPNMSHIDAYAAVKADPDMKATFDAMEQSAD